MRYDKPVYFVKEASKQYDPDSGEWESGEPVKTKKYANVTHMGAERQQTVFGDVRADRHVIRLQRVYSEAFDYVEMGGRRYYPDIVRCPMNDQSLVVMENGGNQD